MSLSEEDSKFVLVQDAELQQYLYAIISAPIAGPLNTTELRHFLTNHFEISTKTIAPSSMPRSQETINYMRQTLEAIDFFLEFSILISAKAYTIPPNPHSIISSIIAPRSAPEKARILSTSLPLSMWSDKRRIRRALLRFQLYCELFHQPGDSSEKVDDWEERFEEQEVFWLRFEWWEVEEVKCVYQVLVFCLENASPRSSISGQVSGDDSQQRGLTQLRHFLDDSVAPPAAFGGRVSATLPC